MVAPTLLPIGRTGCLRAVSATTTTTTSTALRISNSLIPTTQRRTIATSVPLQYRQRKVPDSNIPIPSVSGKTYVPGLEIPPYPYGKRQVYHQSNTGLYGTACIRFGNKVSAKNEIKTRRKWRPNVHHKRLFSQSLNTMVRTRVTMRVLRTIDKCGGLDEYLLGNKTGRIKELGPWGWMLRWRIMQSPAVQERFAAERAALGLEPLGEGQATAQMMDDLKAIGAVEEGVTAAEVIAETDNMLAQDHVFGIGEDSEGNGEKIIELEDEKVVDGLMQEEKVPRKI
ncbi:hypothetical protein B0H66DRAFT_102355 [Apodospora peruviana]|uniref:Large ribosomal subunit protein bL28m n=1 Tax=Apodospora peruviana TaxID=516989 RepID=A0AAE0HSH8_9PEZI|nr:hypothetical protein B0H66DRAFT_102355 [Apodospora peruviana]